MTEEAALRPGQPVGPALLATGRDLLARVGLNEAKSEAESIHDFRRAMKRWRSFLRLVEPLVGDGVLQLRHAARDMARSLAGARDAQAALDALSDLGGDYATLSPRSQATVTERLKEWRATAEQTTLTPAIRDKLQDLNVQSAAALEQWAFDTVTFRDVAESLATGYQRARRAMPRDWTVASAESLHELRSRVVVHRYQMEIVEPVWPRLGKVWVAEAQRLRDRLGKHQDLAVLRGLASSRQLLARWNKSLTPAIDARQRDHIEAALRQAGRLFAERPQDFRRRLEAMWEPQIS
jgi:CHAD domain-containing protein